MKSEPDKRTPTPMQTAAAVPLPVAVSAPAAQEPELSSRTGSTDPMKIALAMEDLTITEPGRSPGSVGRSARSAAPFPKSGRILYRTRFVPDMTRPHLWSRNFGLYFTASSSMSMRFPL